MKTKEKIMKIVCCEYNCSDINDNAYPLCDMYPNKCPGYILAEELVENFILKSLVKDINKIYKFQSILEEK